MSHSNYTPNYGSAREMYAYGADSFHGTDSRPENRAEFDRFINKVKADALREAVEEFESHVGAGEFEEQTCRNGTHWTHAVESWDHQGPFMYWLLNRADQIESGGGAR